MKAPDPVPPGELAAATVAILARVRDRHPRVHCITNTVAQGFTANMLLAAGAVPSMTISADEIAGFVQRADALLVNLGTLDAERRHAVEIAVEQAGARGMPWVLDPVFIDRSPARAEFARRCAAARPAAIRLNAAELAALTPSDAADAARTFATVIGLTGAHDVVTDGVRQRGIGNGHPLMAAVTAMGCAASALVAACLAVESDALIATAAGIAAIGVAGEIAAERARGPGSFAVEIIDAVHGLDTAALTQRMRVS